MIYLTIEHDAGWANLPGQVA